MEGNNQQYPVYNSLHNDLHHLPMIASLILYFSQKQLPREIEPRLVIIVCAGYIFW